MAFKPGTWLALGAAVLLCASCSPPIPTVGPPQERPKPPPTVSVPRPIASEPQEQLPTLFEDVTAGSGLAFTYRNGEEADHYSILESLGGGVALLDYNRDGLLDVFLPGGGYFGGADHKEIGGRPNLLFQNQGSFQFQDVTAEAGLPTEGIFYSHGAAAADYDNDGWPDLLVTGYDSMALYHNVEGRFTDVTATAELENPGPVHWSTSAAWGDLNGDGWLDLFVPHYLDWSFKRNPSCEWPNGKIDLCPPHKFEPLQQALYLSQEGKSFALQKEARLKPARGLGAVIADLDDDGGLDIYLGNDGMDNHLYLNRGPDGFEEAGTRAGVAYDDNGKSTGSMGVDVGDCDGSGRLSLFVGNFESEEHALYRNLGKASFRYGSRTSGIAALGRHLVAFGLGFVDFDRDGQLDIVISNGHVLRHPASGLRKQEAVLLHNTRQAGDPPGKVKFANVSASGGEYFRKPHLGRGVAMGDLDNDGRIDMVISHLNDPVAVLRNVAPENFQWIGIALRGQAPRDAIGAKLVLEQDGTQQVRVIKGGGSYLSTSDRRIVFSLKKDADYRLTVRWPFGNEQSWDAATLGQNRYVELVEGDDRPANAPE